MFGDIFNDRSFILRLFAALLGFCLLIAMPSFAGSYFIEIGFKLLILIVLADAWNLMAGYGGLVSLGASSFFGIGGYVAVGMLNYVSPGVPLALVVAAFAAICVSLLMARALFRLRGLYFTVGTLALAEALRLYVVNVTYFGGATGLFINVDVPELPTLFRTGVVLLAVSSIVMACAISTRFSVLLRAVRDDEDAASQLGVRTFRIKLVAFSLASALIAMVGGLQAVKLGAIEPYGSFGLQWSVDALTMVIIGGIGMRMGSFVGAIFVVVLSEALADYPELHIAITGFILIVVIRFAPRGLCGLSQDLVRYFRRPRGNAAAMPPARVR